MLGRKIAALIVSWKALILVLALLAINALPQHLQFTPKISEYGRNEPYFVWIWGNFDGMHYMSIAQKGYEALKHPFFPLYPLAIRTITTMTGIPHLRAGLIVSHLAFFIACWVLLYLFQEDRITNPLFFLVILLLYPTSFFYGAVYNDALFFLFMCLTLLSTKKKWWVLAGIAGGLATLTRLNGVALAVYVGVEYLIHTLPTVEETWQPQKVIGATLRNLNPKNLFQSSISSILFIPLAFVGYLFYIQMTDGNWRLLFSDMSIWNQDSYVFPLQVVWRYLRILTTLSPLLRHYWVAAIELGFALFYGVVCLLGIRRIRLSDWLFVVISFTIPSLTGTFAGMPRYALHLYPFFVILYLLLQRSPKSLRVLYFMCSVLLMFVIISFFTRGYFIT